MILNKNSFILKTEGNLSRVQLFEGGKNRFVQLLGPVTENFMSGTLRVIG